jgi:hypothetical protein
MVALDCAGVALVVAELAVPAFFIIWFGLGALLVGLLLLVAPAMGMTQLACGRGVAGRWWGCGSGCSSAATTRRESASRMATPSARSA